MLIRCLNDDQRLEQAEPCWSPRGKRCSPSSWESVQTRSKQIVRKIDIWGSRCSLVWRSEEAGVHSACREVWKPGALLGQFKRTGVFTAELCPGMREVQDEVTATLVILVIIKKTPWKKPHPFWFRHKYLWDLIHGRVSVWKEHLASAHLGFEGKKMFFSVSKHPERGLFVCYPLYHLLL